MTSNPAATSNGKSPTEHNAPLFFRKPEPLEAKRHAKAGVMPSQDYGFASETNSLLINAIEFLEAAKHYPIIFTMTDLPLPAAILGLERQNYFVDAKGKWKEDAYVPAYVRKYPFVFMDLTDQQRLLLCIDEEAPQFKKNGGKGTLPLYDGETPSDLARQALEFCTAYHNHHIFTREFCQAIKDAGLLMPTQSKAKLANGREINLSGFQIIDEKKFNALPDEKILEFHKKGWLALLYFALMSATHWKKLVEIAGKREA